MQNIKIVIDVHNKIKTLVIIFSLLISNLSNAQTCKPNFSGMPFEYVSIIRIGHDLVRCHYGDFYYEQIGNYVPVSRNWRGSDTILVCSSENSMECVFKLKN